MESKKRGGDTNELICGTETDSQTLKNSVTKGDRWGGGTVGGMGWGFGIGICTLKYMENI